MKFALLCVETLDATIFAVSHAQQSLVGGQRQRMRYGKEILRRHIEGDASEWACTPRQNHLARFRILQNTGIAVTIGDEEITLGQHGHRCGLTEFILFPRLKSCAQH